jgi:hypothetical protein
MINTLKPHHIVAKDQVWQPHKYFGGGFVTGMETAYLHILVVLPYFSVY